MSADAERVPSWWALFRKDNMTLFGKGLFPSYYEARQTAMLMSMSHLIVPLYSADTIAALRKRPAEQERKEFEDIVSGEPFVRSVERFPDDPERYSWPGDYKDANVSFAWHVWQARAAIDAAQSTEGRNG